MSKLLWILSIVTLPLLMVKYYRFAEIPATHLFLLAAGLMNIGTILKLKSGKIEKVIYSTFILFIVIAFFDLIRTKQTNIDFIFEFKLIVLLITIKLYSFFMSKFGINLFIKWLSVSSGIILLGLLFRSLFIFKAPFFVLDAEIITESGKNQAAFYLALTIPFMFWYFKKQLMSTIWKVVLGCTLAVHLFAAIYVQSKGLLLALIISFGITILFYTNVKFKLTDLLKLGIVSLIPFYFIFSNEIIDLQGFKSDINSLLNQDVADNNSSEERLGLLSKSYNHFSENPFLGIGTNNFAQIEQKATHNNYLQILTENGLIGFMIFIGYLIFSHRKLVKLKSKSVNFLLVINSFWALTIYLFVINGFFNAITTIVLALIIFYEKSVNYSVKTIEYES